MLTRRTLLGLLAAAATAPAAHGQDNPDGDPAFSEDWLREEAQRLAGEEFVQRPPVPEAWRNLTYDQYRAIWFDGRRAVWAETDRPYRVDFFAPGLYFERPVEINVVEDGQARRIPFDLTRFDTTDQFPEMPLENTLGYSGFRLRTEFDQPGIHEEFCVFQGASYFRAVGKGQIYGLSARGLATKTAEQGGEEFPDFTRFWIVAPQPGDETIRVHALLDGPAVTGAYRFDITPGMPARMEILVSLFMRREVANVGIAPLTSMFLFDETNRTRFDDFRSAVHDSEGLLMFNGSGEVLWRQLANPKLLQVSAFLDAGPRGFGLLQRSRELDDYGDLEARYHDRPSLWVTPGEGFGTGSVNLVEIPADREVYDNIVVYWRLAESMKPGAEHRLSYRLDWGGEPPRPEGVDLAPVLKTRMGNGADKDRPGQIVAIDFGPHPSFGQLDKLNSAVSATTGTLGPAVLQQNPGTGGVRVSFRFDPGEVDLSEMRAQLLSGETPVSETWLYRWTA